jgi:hypothetical protein
VVAGGKSISNPLAYSLDNGQTWAESVSGGPNLFPGPDVSANLWGLLQNASYKQCNAVAWNGSKWVAGGLGGVAYSYDGLNWLPNSFAGFRTCNAIVWNGTNWLASGILAGGQQGQATSTDGITWTVNSVGVALGNALAVRSQPVEGNYFTNATQIALGNGAGQTNQAENSIVLNATGLPLNNVSANTLVVKPIRNIDLSGASFNSFVPLYYNISTGEVNSSASYMNRKWGILVSSSLNSYTYPNGYTNLRPYPVEVLMTIAYSVNANANGSHVMYIASTTSGNPNFYSALTSSNSLFRGLHFTLNYTLAVGEKINMGYSSGEQVFLRWSVYIMS